MGANAHWMAQLPEKLCTLPLSSLAIPGSHDTMTYCLDLQSPVLPSQPLVLRLLDRAVPCITRPCLYKWGSAQVHNINEQLDAGIRYFDLRVAHKDSDSACTLYFAHGIYTLTTVMDALEEVFFWLKCHEKEVVILACSMFDGLKSEEHEQLIRFIANLFGKKMCPRKVAVDRASPPVTPSLRIMWDKGYQVIVSYDDDTGSDYEELWPKIPYWWANEVDPVKVIRFLEEQKQIGRPEGFFAAGLNLTEDAKYILTHPGQSLSSLTLESYATFLKWVEKQSPGPEKSCLNIICADFVGAARGNEAVPATNGFASAVIALNKKLLGKLRVQKS